MVTEVQTVTDQQNVPAWVLEWHDPRTLLTDKNIREAVLSDELVASVRNVGVLQAIVAVRTNDGQTRVRYGERRTLAAIAAERDLVPVIVTGNEGDSKAEEAARIIRQRDENTYRDGMKASEDAAAAYQLSLLGMSEKDIIENLQMPRAQVRAAKKIGKSETLSEMIDAYDLDLIEAAKIAEFEDNEERVQELLHRARHRWSLDPFISRYHRQDQEAADRAESRAELEQHGLRVLDTAVGYGRGQVMYVADLRDESGAELDQAEHATNCPGHAAVIEYDEFYVRQDGTLTKEVSELPEEEQADALPVAKLAGVAVCDQVDERHPAPEPSPGEADEVAQREAREAEAKEQARADRRRVIAGNKEWDAAQPTRREWLQKFLQRKTAPAGAMEFIASELLAAHYAVSDAFRDGHPLAADLLGVEVSGQVEYGGSLYVSPRQTALRKLGAEASDKRRMVLLLALVLAGNEKSLNRNSWRQEQHRQTEGCAQREYLRFLIHHGYPACSVERLAAGLPVEEAEGSDADQAGDTADGEDTATTDDTEDHEHVA